MTLVTPAAPYKSPPRSHGCASAVAFHDRGVRPAGSDAVADARAQAAGGRVLLASYLLAPGYFAALAHEAGADVVSAPLLVANRFPPAELVTLVGDRYDDAVASSLAASATGVLS